MSDQPPHYLGIDLGGTNIKAGVVDDSGHPVAQTHLRTEASGGPEHGVGRIALTIERVLAEANLTLTDIEAVGLASPGPMDLRERRLVNPPNLPGWNDFPLPDALAERIGREVAFQNDASAAAYGEFWAGSGSEADSLLLWTLGTGVGSGIIIDHEIVEGAHSYASECGHMIIQMDGGRLCVGTGHRGTVEAYCGARALTLATADALADGQHSLLAKKVEAGETLTPLLVKQVAEAGDELAEALIMELARVLGVACVNIMHVLNPEMIVIGGAMTFGRDGSPIGRAFLDRVRQEVRTRAFPIPAERTKLEFATLGGDAGFIGAAGWARHRLGSSA